MTPPHERRLRVYLDFWGRPRYYRLGPNQERIGFRRLADARRYAKESGYQGIYITPHTRRKTRG